MPYTTPVGRTYDSGEFARLTDRCLELAEWGGFASRKKSSEQKGKLRGRALIYYLEDSGVFNERMELRFDPSGTVTIVAGTHSHGQGHATTYAQMASEWLGVPFEQIRYVQGDACALPFADGEFDVVFSNATLQWLGDHPALIPRLLRAAKPGGTFAFQVPHNMDAPSHALMRETAADGPWAGKLKGIREVSVLTPQDYYGILAPHASSVDIWETEYLHVLPYDFTCAELRTMVAKLVRQLRARAAEGPTVDLVGTVGANRTTGTGTPTPGNTTSAAIGLQLRMPLYTGGLTQNRIKETLSLEDKARNDLEAARRGVAQGTRVAFYGLQSGRAQVSALEAAESSSKLALEATQLGYRVGVRVNLDVLNAQTQLYQTQRDLARFSFEYDGVGNPTRITDAAPSNEYLFDYAYPIAERRMRYDDLYRVGRVDFMTLVDAQMTVNQYEQELYAMLADYGRSIAELPMFKGLEPAFNPPAATWEYVDRLKKLTRMKLMLKGIETREDARLAREHGVDGIIVSNHGGRALDTNRSTIEALAEVVDGAGPGLPVLIDGGFRRGTDIFKALAMGARAVGVGRPYVWGLSAFGQQGVERVLDILRATSEAIYLYKARPELTLPVVARYMRVPKDDPALLQARKDQGQFLNQYLTPSPEGIKFVLEFLSEKQPGLKGKNPRDFIDDRFVRKLEEEGFFKKFANP